VVSERNLTLLILILDLFEEDVEEALFNFHLHLGDDHPAVNLEVVQGSVTDAL